jgi:serine/threonine-protein phosphatase 2A regulatory subunit B
MIVFRPMELMVEATPKRVFGNAHTYHINSISLNSDQETFLSADDLRINLWHTEVTDQSFSTFILLQMIIHVNETSFRYC